MPGEADDGPLRGAVGRLGDGGRGDEPEDGGDVDDRPAAALRHGLRGEHAELEQRGHIDVEGLAERGDGLLQCGQRVGPAGVVDQDVHAAELLGAGDQGRAVVLVGDVAPVGHDPVVLGGQRLQEVGAAGRRDHGRSGRSQCQGEPASESAGGPGHDGDLAAQVDDVGPRGHDSLSMTVALAMPPPSHMVWRPNRPPVRSSSCSMVTISLAPEAPRG